MISDPLDGEVGSALDEAVKISQFYCRLQIKVTHDHR